MAYDRVLVAMSGGVDSSAAALLLLEQGYDAAGATMLLHDGAEAGDGAVVDAKKVCERLGIPHYVFDFRDKFRAVTDDFVGTYLSGGTPNPCVVCNKLIKFGAFMDEAARLGYAKIATGHYARSDGGRLFRGSDRAKDQSYVLWRLTSETVRRVLFPVGDYDKPSIRAAAERAGLEVAHKSDSQDICFIPDGDYVSYIERSTGETYPEGDYLDLAGNLIGRHSGMIRYTPGQRRGVGTGFGERVYVTGKDAERNTVMLGPDSALQKLTVTCRGASFISGRPPESPRVTAKVRYSRSETPGTLELLSQDSFSIKFDTPVRAPAPGQSCVLYSGDELLGGGIII